MNLTSDIEKITVDRALNSSSGQLTDREVDGTTSGIPVPESGSDDQLVVDGWGNKNWGFY
jgi:hypothetical protein